MVTISRTTQLVFVFHGDARFFNEAPRGSFAGFVAFVVPTATTRNTDEGGLLVEGIVRGEFFFGIEFGRERLELSV